MPPIWNLESDVLSVFPAGTIIFFGSDTPPDEYLECDGSLLLRSTYVDLFAAIGELWGAGDGVTTFAVPDLRAEFLYGWDHGRGIDVGRVFASWQDYYTSSMGYSYVHYKGGAATKITTGGSWSFDSTTFNASPTRPRNKAAMVCIKY